MPQSGAPPRSLSPRSLPDEVVAGRVWLHRHRADAAAVMYRQIDAQRQRLGEFLPWVKRLHCVDDQLAYIAYTEQQWQRQEIFDYSVSSVAEDQYMGHIGVHRIDWTSASCEIGYWLLAAFLGQGFMSEALAALEQMLFQQGFHRLEIRCSAANERSARIPARCGYRLEGTLRDHRIEGGVYRDTLVFAKLASDHEKRAMP